MQIAESKTPGTPALRFLLTLSRTVQVASLMIILWSVLSQLKGKGRTVAVAMLGFMLVSLIIVPNPVVNKFRKTFSTEGVDRFSEYPDDRLAFWHAHWEMLKEKPFAGHGNIHGATYRKPYYEKIGLADFKKMYEAHNMFLQIAVNMGLFGLLLFMLWLAWHFQKSISLSNASHRLAGFQTLTIFAITGLTQNAFQDSEVRTGLTLLTLSIWVSTQKASMTIAPKTSDSMANANANLLPKSS